MMMKKGSDSLTTPTPLKAERYGLESSESNDSQQGNKDFPCLQSFSGSGLNRFPEGEGAITCPSWSSS